MSDTPSANNGKTTKKLFLQALKGETLSCPPFWLMRQAGRYLPEYREIRRGVTNFLEFCYTPDLAVEVTLQPLRRYHMDAAILFSDILVIPDALGQKVEFCEGKGPILEPIRSMDGINNLDLDRLDEHLSPVYETVRRLSQEIPNETALIGFAGSPWTVVIYMVEGQGGTDCGKAKTWAYESPDEFQKLIDILVDATTKHLINQVNHGAEAVQLFDSWAGVLSESQFNQWVIKPTVEIVKRFKKSCPNVPIIGFPRGAGVMYKAFVEQTDVDGVSLDTTVPLEWAKNELQSRCTVQGNLDNHLLAAGGEELKRETIRILETMSNGPFIFNLGHGVLQYTPPENVAQVAELIQGWKGPDPCY